jgi:pimeloyl-ACP methyl ester carboxylesterase
VLSIQALGLLATTLYQAIASWREDRLAPPGQRFDVGGYHLHLYQGGEGTPTIVLDHSLGGVEGYLLIDRLAPLGRVCIYDRAGYGWSDHSPHPRTSSQIVTELDQLLTQANIAPPYILVGNSFGSYNVRLYADRFPAKVSGLVLTDGLHETGMLAMSLPLQALKLFFISGFLMSVAGATMGLIRLLKQGRVFEWLKPELRQFSSPALQAVTRSFCRPKHWITMSREMVNLDKSGQALRATRDLGTLPIVSIQASSFFKPSLWTRFIPLKGANRLRDHMHTELLHLSTRCVTLPAHQSGHFVWIDQPDVLVDAVKWVIDQGHPKADERAED